MASEGSPSPERGSGDRVLLASEIHGGLVVLAGCRDADLAMSLATRPNVLVHALVPELDVLHAMRREIQEAGLYGRVSAMSWDRPSLPYADGMVNLLLVTSEELSPEPGEIARVLAPLGIARSSRGGTWTSYRKPPPADVDQWSHSRHDATGNAVSEDRRVGPPRHLQWEALPRWNRGTKTSALVTMRGRIFYILDDSHFAARSRTWSLIARDASNGIRLWRQELPGWPGARGGKKVGPAQVHRRLVATDDRVFVTPGESAPVSVLNPANGKRIQTLEPTGQAEEFVVSDGVLVALANPNTDAGVRRGQRHDLRLVAVNPDSGEMLWERRENMILPLTLAADREQVVCHDGQAIRSFDLRTGAPRWTSPPTGQRIVFRDRSNPDSPGSERSTIILAPQFAPTLIIYRDVVAFAGGRQLNVVSARNGEELWRSEYAASNYSVPVDLFGFDGALWGPDPGMNLWRPLDDNIDFNAHDPLTGAIQKRARGKYGFRFQHHRCHQMKVVGSQIIAGRAGVEFLDTASGEVAAHHWLRGSCFFGVLPANGRLYVPPHNCACYVRAKLSGFLALNSGPPSRSTVVPQEDRLRGGPAQGTPSPRPGTVADSPGRDWPTYRHDAARSGGTAARVSSELLPAWRVTVGGKLTSPVIADGRVYLASSDAHTLHALEATSGKPLWRSTFDARIDSPPTVHRELVLCGCRDGSVRALRAIDGALVWRFIAAPYHRLIVSRGQLESVWPVHGSVLVVRDTVYFAAGRSSYLDGGIRLYGLAPETGEERVEAVLSSRRSDGSETIDPQGVDGWLADILSSDGRRMFMRHQAIDWEGRPQPQRVSHLHSPDGYLSGDTTDRLLWTHAPMFTSPHQGAFYDVRLSRVLFPSGRILVEDGDTVYGFGQNHYERPLAEPGGQWALFAAPGKGEVPLDLSAVEYRRLALSGKRGVKYHWWREIPIRVRAIVKTEGVLFVAGHRGSDSIPQAALEGKTGGLLLAIEPDGGSVLAESALPSAPVWDGMAAAGDSLYLALTDGQVLRMSPPAPHPGSPLSF